MTDICAFGELYVAQGGSESIHKTIYFKQEFEFTVREAMKHLWSYGPL